MSARVGKLMTALTALACLTGCGPGRTGGLGIVTLDPSVPVDQQLLLEDDLRELSILDIPGGGAELQVMNIERLDGQSMTRWLRERVKVVVGEHFDGIGRGGTPIGAAVPTVMGGGPSAGGMPADPELLPWEEPEMFSATALTRVMSNTGAYLYLRGLQTRSLYTVELGRQSVLVNSPRAGIIQIGQGLFSTIRVASSPPGSRANRWLRITVLMHEARHSDGNGANAGMPHSICPAGLGRYSQNPSCEGYSNGPYAVQLMLLRHFRNMCMDCTRSEQVVMDNLILDFERRILPGGRYADDRPEGIF